MPAADKEKVVQTDAAGHVAVGILTQHVPQADAGLKTPLEMLSALEDDAGLQADVPFLELFLSVPGIEGIGIDVVCVGNDHIGALRPQSDDHTGPFRIEMVAGLAEDIGHRHPLRVSAVPADVVDFSQLGAETGARHQGPSFAHPHVQPVGQAQYGAGEDDPGLVSGLAEQAGAQHDIALQLLPGSVFLRPCGKAPHQGKRDQ